MAPVEVGDAGAAQLTTGDEGTEVFNTLPVAPRPSSSAGLPSSSSIAPRAGLARPSPTKPEKRVTRSSLGGPSRSNDSRRGSDVGLTSQPNSYLPAGTSILITTQQPQHATLFPIKLFAADEALLNAQPHRPAHWPDDAQECRLLTTEDEFLKATAWPNKTVDTSDAFYQRLHRYPEVLEKRSARLEKERLIHERNKLVLELEDLKGRGWVYTGAQGGKSEEDRRRKIREMEEKLKRYDLLLPNQPRKSNSLSSLAHANGAEHSRRRSESPALSAKSRPRPRGTSRNGNVSDNGTRIKLSFGAGTSSAADSISSRGIPHRGGGKTTLPPRRRPSHADDDEDADEDDDHAKNARVSKAQARARRAQPAAAQRRRVSQSEAKRPRIRSDPTLGNSQWQVISEDEDDDEDDGEQYHNPYAKRIRLPDSFFSNPSLRDSFLAASKSRRQSSRLLYAFGQRLPDEVTRQQEFVLYGGTSGILAEDTAPGFSQKTLEDMIVERGGEAQTVVDGIVVPKSAVDALGHGPVISVTRGMTKSQALEKASAAAAAAATGTASSAKTQSAPAYVKSPSL
ncbi:hypothetical protein OIO90_000714 [Microbotryomycetes sp. JL221]|nr:hypothetical protein OIO90_000714 [Microbotryomycetes sp. JL221]